MIGTKLGTYEITAKLGEGGMGEVWRATDSKLRRDVAIKVLPAAFTADKDRLARFEREAQLLAQLQHPNIASIYGLEESGGALALVMELVDGPTLAERLAGGAIPSAEALPIAVQIAEALEAAHEQGIVHRDLKPQNIKLSRDGTVKVLDFGLAKAMEPVSSAASVGRSPAVMHSPTLTAAGTQLGVILGTAAYMSPEQARGLPVDRRVDIWAFGVVLWEMLTGAALFAADTVSDTLAGVLKNEIDQDRLPPATPAAVRRLLRRCLERNPKNRLHDIADARLVLTDVIAGKGDAIASAAAPARPRRGLAAGAAVIALVALALGYLSGRRGTAERAGVARAERADGPFTLRRLTELPGPEHQPTLSPDGRMLVYASAADGNLDLFLLRVGGDRAIRLTDDPADDSQATFSPDGERIAFRSGRDGGGLFVMGATGESVRRVTDTGFDPAWSPDSRRLAYATEAVGDPLSREVQSELWTAEIENGKRTRLYEGDAVQPAWSRDGTRIAFWSNVGGQRDLFTIRADGGAGVAPVAVTRDVATDWSPEWSPDGRWLYFSSDRGGSFNLWRIAIDPAKGGASGEPLPVTNGVRGIGYARFSADGSRFSALAYERTFEQTLYEIADRRPGEEVRLRPLRTLRNPSARWCSLSPDGERLACNTAGAPEDLVVMRSDGTELRRLTADSHKDRIPLWDSTGKRLVFYSTRSGRWEYWTIGADGSDLRQLTSGLDQNVSTAAWVPESDDIYVATAADHQLIDSQAPPGSARTVPGPKEGPQWEHQASHSGERWAAVLGRANEQGGAGQLLVYSRGGGSRRVIESPLAGRSFGSFAGWLAGDREVIVRGAGAAFVLDIASGQSRRLLETSPNAHLALSFDGRTLKVENEVLDADVWLMEMSGAREEPR